MKHKAAFYLIFEFSAEREAVIHSSAQLFCFKLDTGLLNEVPSGVLGKALEFQNQTSMVQSLAALIHPVCCLDVSECEKVCQCWLKPV